MMITTHTNILTPNYTDGNKSNYFNAMAISIADEQGELCTHWIRNAIRLPWDSPDDESEEENHVYDYSKIKLIFEEASIHADFKIRIICRLCHRRGVGNEDNRYVKTEKILTKQFLNIYEANLNQNQRQVLEF
jgi:hypothetical protein